MPFGPMLEELSLQGFRFGVDTWLRLNRWVGLQAAKPEAEVSAEQTRYGLAAILCTNQEEQAVFFEIFKKYFPDDRQPVVIVKPPPVPPELKKPSEEILPPPPAGPPPAPPPEAQVSSSRKGPIRIELSIPESSLRPWNHESMDKALQPLREKVWADTYDWDIPATIRKTIQAGGIPQFVYQQRKQAPYYLVLIEQLNARDHLAAFYQEMALEMNRRDLDAGYYFFNGTPHLCWKERDTMRRRIPIERLQTEFPDARMLIVGKADTFLELPNLRPSNLAISLAEKWEEIALLCTRPTPDWGPSELTLCQLFPVVPATAEGLVTLIPQWNAVKALTPSYWQMQHPEPVMPKLEIRRAEDISAVLSSLRRYLGAGGFRWLCAVAFYPELLFELSVLFDNEAIPPQSDLSEWEQNYVWWVSLGRLCRLPWLRDGYLPNLLRAALRERLPEEDAKEVRRQLLEVLRLPGNQPPSGTYAEAARSFTVAWLESEQEGRLIDDYLPSDQEILLSDIEDAIGRKILQQQRMPPPDPVVLPDGKFRILWVTNDPRSWEGMQNRLNESVGTIARTTADWNEQARQFFKKEHFSLIVYDTGEGGSALEFAKKVRASNVHLEVVIYQETQSNVGYALEGFTIFNSSRELESFIRQRVQDFQGQQASYTSSSYEQTAGAAPEEPAYEQTYQSNIPPRENAPESSVLAEQAFISLIQKSDSAGEAFKVLDQMRSEGLTPGTPVFNALMGKMENWDQAMSLVSRMKDEGIRADTGTFVKLVEKAPDFGAAANLQELLYSWDLRPDHDYNRALLGKAGNISEIRFVLDQMRQQEQFPTLEDYTLAIKKTDNPDDARNLFEEMRKADIRPDVVAYTTYLSKLETYKNARSVFDEMKKEGIHSDPVIYTTLLDKTENFEQARATFEELEQEGIKPNRGMYTQVMSRAKKDEDADWVEEQMRKVGIGDGTIRRTRQSYKKDGKQEKTANELERVVLELRELIVEGLDVAIESFKKYLSPDSEKMNQLFLLEARNRQNNRDILRATISSEQAQITNSQLRLGLLQLIDSLTPEDLAQVVEPQTERPAAETARRAETQPENVQIIIRDLRETLPQGIDLTFQALKNQLVPGTDLYNDMLLVESRYKDTTSQLLQNTIPEEAAQSAFNKIRKDLLDLINSLQEGHLKETVGDGQPSVHNGELFYRIPRKMILNQEEKCLVRLAFDKKTLMENLVPEEFDKTKNLRISDVMGIELLDAGEQVFNIRTLHDTVMFVEKSLFTEWIFYVKPLKTGRFPLVMKVSVVEIVNGLERKRNVVLEEGIEVLPGSETSDPEFQSTGETLGNKRASAKKTKEEPEKSSKQASSKSSKKPGNRKMK